MTNGTTQLTRLRTRMLAAAYSNADFWIVDQTRTHDLLKHR